MAIPITDANDINSLLNWSMGRSLPGCGPVTAGEAVAAARRLAAKAHRALSAGLTAEDVDLTHDLAPGPQDGVIPAGIDGMTVRAAFPTPPERDDCLEHWTLILCEASGPGGGTYRLCRARRAGGPGEWEVLDGLPGAQELTWMLAAEWFASAVRAEAGSAEPPLQEDLYLPR